MPFRALGVRKPIFKSSTAAYTASLQSKLGSEAKPNEVLAVNIALLADTFQTRYSGQLLFNFNGAEADIFFRFGIENDNIVADDVETDRLIDRIIDRTEYDGR